MNDQRRPKAPHESATTDPIVAAGTDFTAEDRHAAYCAGYDDGMHHRFGLEIEDRARALLHEQARVMLGFARRLAAAKGPAWGEMIVWSGAADE